MSGLVVSFFEWFGELGLFCRRLGHAIFVPPYEGRELVRQLDSIGSKSLPLVAMAGGATGVVLSLQTRASLTTFGAKSMLPAVIIFSIIKESGPIITALIVSGRVGAGIGAELGSMKVTEQIDAMEVSAVNPYRYLVVTRTLATTLMVPMLTIFADLVALFGGYVAMNIHDNMTLQHFFLKAMSHLEFIDVFPALVKTFFFGYFIGIIGCYKGYNARRGTESVGIAANAAVVASLLAVFVIDLIAAQITDLL